MAEFVLYRGLQSLPRSAHNSSHEQRGGDPAPGVERAKTTPPMKQKKILEEVDLDTAEHLNRLRCQLNDVFDKTSENNGVCREVGYYSGSLFDFSENISDDEIREIIVSTASQFESAALFSAFGLYRQAMASLRLALELGFVSVYFSANRLELQEWRNGTWDLKWSQVSDPDSGVLSIRYARAFFDGLAGDVTRYNIIARATYRSLSEYVHGNFQTWNSESHVIDYDQTAAEQVWSLMKASFEVILFALTVRFVDQMQEAQLDKVEFVRNEFEHVEPLRLKFGGPKG